MKNMTKVLMSVALSSSLIVSTLGDSASARWSSNTQTFGKNAYVTYMFVKSDSGVTKEINITDRGRVYVSVHKGYNVTERKANFNLVLSNNKRLKIKDGVIYSKGKLYTGSAVTKKALKKSDFNTTKKEEFQLTLTVQDGKVVKGKTYKKLWLDDNTGLE